MDAYQILRELCSSHEVTLFTFAEPGDAQHVATLRQICRQVVTVRVPASPGTWRALTCTALSFLSGFPAIARMTHSAEMVGRIREVIARESFDVVHVEFTQMAHYIDYLGNLPVVLDESDIAFVRRRRFASTVTSRLKRTLLDWDTRKLQTYEMGNIGKYSAVLVRTETDKQLLCSEMPGLRVEVIPPWVDISFAHAQPSQPNGNDLLFYGAMWRPVNEQAAHYFIDEIFPLVADRAPQARCVIAGSKPSARLRRRACHNVLVTGYVDSIAPYYSSSAFAVVPLRSGAGIKGKVIQAMACGKPVVTTWIGAEGIPAGEADGLFVRDDPRSFAECVAWLLQDRRYLQFAAPAQMFVKRYYNWTVGMRRLHDLYAEVVGRSTPELARS